ncbi:MAG: amino acid transporter [Psychromonas sp.]|jgi:amino acid transporter|uniref:YfiR family protein n=1 Tax=Psychromonas sp. TaxID=1884585 RepID=UPI0039E44A64
MFVLRKCSASLLLVMILFVSGQAAASSREYAIKSGFIYNFARYSHGEWFNAELKPTYNICSFDAQFVDIATYTLKARTIENRSVVVHLLTSEFKGITDCNTLFLSKNDIDKWDYLSKNEPLSKLMLVGEFDGFIGSGGHLNFFIVGGKVRFEVNPDKLKQSGIDMSSKVLRLGRTNKGSL